MKQMKKLFHEMKKQIENYFCFVNLFLVEKQK